MIHDLNDGRQLPGELPTVEQDDTAKLDVPPLRGDDGGLARHCDWVCLCVVLVKEGRRTLCPFD